MPQPSAVTLAKLGRDDEAGELLADDLVAPVTEDLFRGEVELRYLPAGVHRDDAIEGGIEQCPIQAAGSDVRRVKRSRFVFEFHQVAGLRLLSRRTFDSPASG